MMQITPQALHTDNGSNAMLQFAWFQ